MGTFPKQGRTKRNSPHLHAGNFPQIWGISQVSPYFVTNSVKPDQISLKMIKNGQQFSALRTDVLFHYNLFLAA